MFDCYDFFFLGFVMMIDVLRNMWNVSMVNIYFGVLAN